MYDLVGKFQDKCLTQFFTPIPNLSLLKSYLAEILRKSCFYFQQTHHAFYRHNSTHGEYFGLLFQHKVHTILNFTVIEKKSIGKKLGGKIGNIFITLHRFALDSFFLNMFATATFLGAIYYMFYVERPAETDFGII